MPFTFSGVRADTTYQILPIAPAREEAPNMYCDMSYPLRQQSLVQNYRLRQHREFSLSYIHRSEKEEGNGESVAFKPILTVGNFC